MPVSVRITEIDETAVRLCCLYHFSCEILISHGTRSFHLDEQVGGQKFCHTERLSSYVDEF